MERFEYPEKLPLSLAVRTSEQLVFLCGHVGDVHGLEKGAGIEEQTRACLESIETSLKSLDLGLDRTAIIRSLCFFIRSEFETRLQHGVFGVFQRTLSDPYYRRGLA